MRALPFRALSFIAFSYIAFPLMLIAACLCFTLKTPANAEDLPTINRGWVNDKLEEIDKFAAQCGANVECGQETARRYSEVCDLMTKKISDLCRKNAGDNAHKCQQELAALLESNSNARMQSGKLLRFLYSGLSEDAILERILASDMALLGSYIDTLGVMLPE